MAGVAERAERLVRPRRSPCRAHRLAHAALETLLEGKGPPHFMGVPLNKAAGERTERVREQLRSVFAQRPNLIVIDDPLPHDERLFIDGLHPAALGMQHYAQKVITALG